VETTEQELVNIMKQISKLATHAPLAIVEDILGLASIFIIVMVGLYLPGL